MIKRTTIYILTVTAVLFFSCSKDAVLEKKPFDVVKYHQSFITDIITPAINEFVSDVNNLDAALANFTSNINESNLSTLRSAWTKAAISFSKTEIGNLGEIQTSAIYISIYSWGANETSIEEYIASTGVISESTVNRLPTNVRGLSALEYLLFDTNLTATQASFSNQRRIDFLLALNENLLKKAISLQEQWTNYNSSFINNTTTGINGSINRLVNQVNFLLENVRRFKVGEPSGIENSTVVDTTLLQADKSEISLELIKKNIASVKAVYYGNSDGLDDYVTSIANNQEINDAISTVFSNIENRFDSLSNTALKNAINDNPTDVKALYNSIKDLILLIKVDVASTLSVTVTFTDNDGD